MSHFNKIAELRQELHDLDIKMNTEKAARHKEISELYEKMKAASQGASASHVEAIDKQIIHHKEMHKVHQEMATMALTTAMVKKSETSPSN